MMHAVQSSELPSWKMQLPNALTIFRLVLAVGMFVLLALALSPPDIQSGLTEQMVVLRVAAGLVVAASSTDTLDGHLARRWNAVPLFGRVVDAAASQTQGPVASVTLSWPGA